MTAQGFGRKQSYTVKPSTEAKALEIGLAKSGFFKLTRGQVEAAKSTRTGRQRRSA